MNLCVIPARGGSKRIPKKNIKFFHGKPIITWSIETAIKSKCFDKIIVSTDNNKIAKIAKSAGAEVPFMRPKYLSDDFTGTGEVVSHAIKWYKRKKQIYSNICCIYATAPLINYKDIKKSLKILKISKADYAFSVTNYSYPIQRSFKINLDKRVEMFMPKYYYKRSQDLEDSYHDAGQFYWGTSEAWINSKKLFSKNAIPILLPKHKVQDIDTLDDWRLAEIKFSYLLRKR